MELGSAEGVWLGLIEGTVSLGTELVGIPEGVLLGSIDGTI